MNCHYNEFLSPYRIYVINSFSEQSKANSPLSLCYSLLTCLWINLKFIEFINPSLSGKTFDSLRETQETQMKLTELEELDRERAKMLAKR